MTRRALLVLAMLAALHGAPPTLLAAAPNLATAPADTRDVGELLLVLGIVVGVVAVALVATGWLLAARTRDDDRDTAQVGTTPAGRARRRARASGHDPVLAAMGLDDDEASPPAPEL
jgi:hypothetical protein